MRSIIPVFTALIKGWLRTKTGIFFSFLFPLMLLLLFGTIFGGTGTQKYTLFIQNFDLEDGKQTELSEAFINALESTNIFEIRKLDPEIDINTYVKENPSFEYNYRILKIPKGFEKKLYEKSMTIRLNVILSTFSDFEKYSGSMNPDDLKAMREGKEKLTQLMENLPASESVELIFLAEENDMSAMAVEGIIESVINAFNNRLIGVEERAMTITAEPLAEKNMTPGDYYLPGYIAAFIMTNGVIGATATISELRRNGTVKRLAATPLSKSSWILSNILQQTTLAFMLTAVMVIFGWIIFDVHALPNIYAILLIFMGAVTFSSIGMILGGVIKDVEAASGAGNAIAFPMMFLSGAFWPIEMMPGYLQTIAKFLPLYYFHDGLRSIMIMDNPSGASLSFLIMGVLAVVLIVIATKVTRWKEL